MDPLELFRGPRARIALFVVGVLGAVLLVVWANAGFTLEIGRFFANEGTLIPDTSDSGGAGGGGAPTGGSGTGGTPTTGGTSTVTTGPCEPVKAPDWVPPADATTNASGQKVAANGKPYCTPPPGKDITFSGCFIADYTDYKKEYSNFADLNAIGNPLNVVTKHGAKVDTVGYRGMAINNCPWTVHYSFRSIGSKKAGADISGLDQGTEVAFTRSLPPGAHDAPSCWNNTTGNTCDKEFQHEILYKINTYTCGRVFAAGTWDHYVSGGGPGPADKDGENWAVVFNYGRDCTGSLSERAPGSVTVGGGAGGSGSGTLPKAVTLTVQCSATQNSLQWTAAPAGSNSLSILRSVDGATNVSIAAPPMSATSYTDTQISAGHTYRYTVKNHPSVASNAVTCPTGSTGGASPTPIPTQTVAPTLAPTVTPGATNDDLDGDGVLNEIECPGFVDTSSISTCPDTDSDGVQDVIDPDSDNDGIPDATDPDRLQAASSGGTGGTGGGAGGVSTGPGEATVLALLVSAAVSLLYVSYAHSPLGRRREAESVARDQSPMDFRG